LSAELPFVLMHPKPEDDEPPLGNCSSTPTPLTAGEVPVDNNLIQLDTYVKSMYMNNYNEWFYLKIVKLQYFIPSTFTYRDDDIIFEDFARLRLKGETE
jgi:beta-arrestin